jgi:hypothetical protein
VHVALCTDEGERNRLRHTGSAVFDGEDELLAETAQGEGRIDPGKEVTGPAQALASGGVATVFACMVDDRDSEVVGALQLAQISKDGSYVTGLVLVDAMEPYEGVKEEQTRRFATHGLVKAALVVRKVEAYAGRGDDADGKHSETETAVATDAGEPLFDHGRRIFGHVNQDAAGLYDVECIETGGAAGDGDRHIEAEPAFAALGRAANDADTGASPEVLDEPASRGVRLGEVGRTNDGEDGFVVGFHPVTVCADGDASMAASMVWSSMNV